MAASDSSSALLWLVCLLYEFEIFARDFVIVVSLFVVVVNLSFDIEESIPWVVLLALLLGRPVVVIIFSLLVVLSVLLLLLISNVVVFLNDTLLDL